MNGAHALLDTLTAGGIDVCFANPGTSEMHFVAALDNSDMRAVLALFEGVATGAADGYARIAGKPACVLMHLGPGLGNGLANLHNARRAQVPMVVVVGDHATNHRQYDAPLQSDIEAVAKTVSGWVKCSETPAAVGADTAEAIAVATAKGCVATLILPADASWTDGAEVAAPQGVTAPSSSVGIDAAVAALQSGDPVVILIGGDAVATDEGLADAARVAAATGATVLCETFPTRLRHGAGVAAVGKLAYLTDLPGGSREQLRDARHLVLAGAKSPVSFFAYPGRRSDLVPEGCAVHTIAGPTGAAAALADVAQRIATGVQAPLAKPACPERPSGPLNGDTVMQAVGALLPPDAIIVDEGNTSSATLLTRTAGAPAHDVLTLTGGSIGFGLPTALGAAIGGDGRPVLCLESDGSAMYTISALWSHKRENLDITTVILNNGKYAILGFEMLNTGAVANGAEPGPKAASLLDLGSPTIDFVKIAEGMGVPAQRATTAEDFTAALEHAFADPGPHLIEAVLFP